MRFKVQIDKITTLVKLGIYTLTRRAPQEIWEKVRLMFVSGVPLRTISDSLMMSGFKLSPAAISRHAKKNEWTPILQTLTNQSKAQADLLNPSRTLVLDQTFSEMTIKDSWDIMKRNTMIALKITGETLEQTLQALKLRDMDPYTASKIISSVGFDSVSIAKLVGISTDANLIKEISQDDNEKNQIQFYMPDNGRQLKEK